MSDSNTSERTQLQLAVQTLATELGVDEGSIIVLDSDLLPVLLPGGSIPIRPNTENLSGLPVGQVRVFATRNEEDGTSLWAVFLGRTADLNDAWGVRWVAKRAGAAGNAITIEYVMGGTGGTTVEVTDSAIKVLAETDSDYEPAHATTFIDD